MAVQTDATLKGYFETDDAPTEAQFGDLIDSKLNIGNIDDTPADDAETTITSKWAYDNLLFPGAIMAFGGTVAPTGWLLCDGTSYLRATYAALYAVVGDAYGTADGTHFNVPDFQGRFLRGVDNATGRDPDAAGRTAMDTGGNTGDNVGSIQDHAHETHTHGYSATDAYSQYRGAQGTGANIIANNAEDSYTTTAPSGNISTETRPLNAYVNYIIKT